VHLDAHFIASQLERLVGGVDARNARAAADAKGVRAENVPDGVVKADGAAAMTRSWVEAGGRLRLTVGSRYSAALTPAGGAGAGARTARVTAR
jgi:hypothetical protein